MATPTTEEYWDVDGTILNRYGFNISTLTGRLSLPDIKGGDLTIPHRTGDQFRRKWAGGRTLTLSMWVRGTKLDANGGAVIDDEAQYNENFTTLVRALYHLEWQMALTKRWKTNNGLLTATALCSYAGGLAPTHDGDRTLSKFSVDLRLQDPWFYGPELSTGNIHPGQSQAFTNPGHVDLTGFGLFVEFHGPLVNPRFLLTKPSWRTVWVQYTGTIPSGSTVTLDIENFRATNDNGDNLIQNISRAGNRSWMTCWRFGSTYSLTADSGNGYALLRMRPAYV